MLWEKLFTFMTFTSLTHLLLFLLIKKKLILNCYFTRFMSYQSNFSLNKHGCTLWGLLCPHTQIFLHYLHPFYHIIYTTYTIISFFMCAHITFKSPPRTTASLSHVLQKHISSIYPFLQIYFSPTFLPLIFQSYLSQTSFCQKSISFIHTIYHMYQADPHLEHRTYLCIFSRAYQLSPHSHHSHICQFHSSLFSLPVGWFMVHRFTATAWWEIISY